MRSTLACVCAVALATAAFAGEETTGNILSLALKTDKAAFQRGEIDPAKDLIATLTAQNTSDVVVASLPDLASTYPLSEVEFEINRVGSPTGETFKVAQKVKMIRKPALESVSNAAPVKKVALQPGKSADFKIDLGRLYHFDAAGNYEITASFRQYKSNTITVEILPMKRVDEFSENVIENLDHFEMGKPEFPFMFYIAKSRENRDEVMFVRRSGPPEEGRYDDYRLCRIPRGGEVQVVASGQKVGVLAKDPWDKWFLYTVDFSGKLPAVVTKPVEAAPGTAPVLTKSPEGEPQVQAGGS